jgi:hypothetical protein
MVSNLAKSSEAEPKGLIVSGFLDTTRFFRSTMQDIPIDHDPRENLQVSSDPEVTGSVELTLFTLFSTI